MRASSLPQRLASAFLVALAAPAASACGGSLSEPADGGPSTDGSATTDARVPDSAIPLDACPSGPLPASNSCAVFVAAPCDYDGGSLSPQECAALCPSTSSGGYPLLTCYPSASGGGGSAYVSCSYCGVTGRLSEGQAPAPPFGDSPGDFFAHCAYLEAASVHSFRRLARELAAHGAPARLVARATRAARDEVAHTRTTRALSRRHGGSPRAAHLPRTPVRDLFTVARENAVEGCVRETFGVLVGMWQAERARDPEVRRALRTIARDEARHAGVARDVAVWAHRRLAPAEKRAVEEARLVALAELRAQLAEEPSPSLVAQAGLPRACEALRLLDAALAANVFDGTRTRSAAPRTSRRRVYDPGRCRAEAS